MGGGGGQERGLVQPDRRRCPETGQVIDAGLAVIPHRGHGRVPAHPEALRRPGDGLLTEPDPAGDLGSGPLGEHRPRGDLVGLLRPGPHRAGRLRAAPQPLGPHQHHRPIGDRQIPHLDPAAAVADGADPAGRAPGPVLGRLDRQPPLARLLVEQLGAHDEPVEPEQRRHATTVAFHQGPLLLMSAFDSRINSEAPDRARGPESVSGQRTRPHASSSSDPRAAEPRRTRSPWSARSSRRRGDSTGWRCRARTRRREPDNRVKVALARAAAP